MIRNFIYLDSLKLRSLSSQLFEGVAEQVILTDSQSDSSREEQKGPMASGKLLAEIFSKERSSSELRFMEDHAYTLFEDRLHELSLIDEISFASGIGTNQKSFVKATARLQLNDLAVSSAMLKNFNDIGEAIWRVRNENMSTTSDQKIHSDNEARKKAGEEGFQLHKKVSDAASLLLEFGFGDLLEANLAVSNGLVSAPLKREFLRDTEAMLIHKYSRITAIEFTILGLVTQNGLAKETLPTPPDVKDGSNMKEAMRSLASHMRELEETFVGASTNEVIVDPVAIYSVL